MVSQDRGQCLNLGRLISAGGDQEDLAGRPFVGPAGLLFYRAMN